MGTVSNGSIVVSDGGVNTNIKTGAGLNAATRTVQQQSRLRHVEASPYMPSFSSGYSTPPIFNQAALSDAGSEPYEGFSSDIAFWFGSPEMGSGYMN